MELPVRNGFRFHSLNHITLLQPCIRSRTRRVHTCHHHCLSPNLIAFETRRTTRAKTRDRTNGGRAERQARRPSARLRLFCPVATTRQCLRTRPLSVYRG